MLLLTAKSSSSSNGRNNNNMFCISCVAREWMGPFGGFFYFFLFSFWVGKAPFLTCLEEIIPRPDMELAHKSTKSLMQKNTRASIYDTRDCTTFFEGGFWGGGHTRHRQSLAMTDPKAHHYTRATILQRKSKKQQRIAFGIN